MVTTMSPKRPLSLSRDGGASVSLRDALQTTPTRPGGPKQGAKPTEVYGFVGAISTLVGSTVFLMWAYLPERWLHSMGVTYYPSRYWAMALPAYVLVAISFAMVFYASLNYMATPPPWSLDSLFDEHTRAPSRVVASAADDRPIHAIADVPIATVNALLFGEI